MPSMLAVAIVNGALCLVTVIVGFAWYRLSKPHHSEKEN